jgi:16S rRNA processing protein RimM
MSEHPFDDRHLQLGYVAGAHGVRGAVRVKLFNPDSSAIAPGVRVLLREAGQTQTQAFEVARVAPAGDVWRLWLVGVDDREAAEQLRGRELWIDRSELPALADDEYYLADLIGLPVEREHDGRVEPLGKITGVTSNGAQDLLCVRLRGREWLLPALPPFVLAIEPTRVLVDVHDDMLPDADERGSA